MLRTFLLGALRNLLRHKLQSSINIASLAIGLTVFGFAFLYVKQELSYDRAWPDGERIHRLVMEQRGLPGMIDGEYLTVAGAAWPGINEYFASQYEYITRISTWGARPKGATGAYARIAFVDSGFADIFQLQVEQGDMERVLSGPGFVALEAAHAERIGYTGGIGGRITLESSSPPGEIEYEVAAIYRYPPNVSPAVNFPYISLIHDYSLALLGEARRFAGWQQSVGVWLKLRPGITTDAFNALAPEFIQQEVTIYNDAIGPERRISDHLIYRWQPLTELHFNPVGAESVTGLGAGDPARVATFAAVGLLVLLVGCSNSISLSLAEALERRREIGVRKAAGALQRDILQQQLVEAVMRALLALIPAICLLELLRDPFQALMPFTVQITVGVSEYLLMAVIASLVGLLSGFYPALVLSATRPQAVLKAGAQESTRGSLGLRSLLVGMQFCFASMLLIGTAALYLQLAVTRSQPLGFDVDDTVFVIMGGGPEQSVSAAVLSDTLAKVPGVRRVAPALNPPNANMPPSANRTPLVRERGAANEVQALSIIGDGFVDALGMKLLAGRDFDPARDFYKPPPDGAQTQLQEQPVLVNATLAREMGFATPEEAVEQAVYRRFTVVSTGTVNESPLRIIGVVGDNLYASFRRQPGPEMYLSLNTINFVGANNMLVKYEEAAETGIQESIRGALIKGVGRPPVNMMFMEPQMDAAFQQERNESKLLLICGGIALLLSCIGLYGLAAFSIERRVKEIGVRKALGAASGSIVLLLLLRFARPVLIANVIAWPFALYFVLQWIERFPYQMERAWLGPLCIATLVMVLVIALLAVGVMATRAATANPVHSLRYE